jgi:hypothetical protein
VPAVTLARGGQQLLQRAARQQAFGSTWGHEPTAVRCLRQLPSSPRSGGFSLAPWRPAAEPAIETRHSKDPSGNGQQRPHCPSRHRWPLGPCTSPQAASSRGARRLVRCFAIPGSCPLRQNKLPPLAPGGSARRSTSGALGLRADGALGWRLLRSLFVIARMRACANQGRRLPHRRRPHAPAASRARHT